MENVWKLGIAVVVLCALGACSTSGGPDDAKDASRQEGAATPDAGSRTGDAGLRKGDAGPPPSSSAVVDGGTASQDASMESDAGPAVAVDAGPLRIEGLPDELHDELVAMCETFHAARCAAVHEWHPGAVDLDHCVAWNVATCTGSFLPRYAGAFREGRIVYDAEALDACLEEARQQSAGGPLPLSWAWPPREIEACRGVFAGTVAVGEPCYQPNAFNFLGAVECADGQCVIGDRSVCPGVCTAYLEPGDACNVSSWPSCRPYSQCVDGRCIESSELFPKAGEGCSPGGRRCADQLTCLPDTTGAYLCVPLRELGESCEIDGDCARGACVGATCQLASEGEPCWADVACMEGLSCNGATGVCALPQPARGECLRASECEADLLCLGGYGTGSCTEGDVGSSCCPAGTFDCGGGCREGLVCDQSGHCRAPGDVGDPCDVGQRGDQATCLLNLLCSPSGTCIRPIPLGGPCSGDLECGIDAYCDHGTCARHKRPGEPCQGNAECGGICQSGRCEGTCEDY